jgi:hypothetical protein
VSIEKVSATRWKFTTPVGDVNHTIDIIATEWGLEIDYNTIAWHELQQAIGVLKLPTKE